MATNRRPIDYRALRRIPPVQVLALHGWHPVLHYGDSYRGPCPYPECTCRHTRIYRVGPQVGRCFRCHRWGDAVDLHAHLTGLQPYEAALDLCNRLNLDVPYI